MVQIGWLTGWHQKIFLGVFKATFPNIAAAIWAVRNALNCCSVSATIPGGERKFYRNHDLSFHNRFAPSRAPPSWPGSSDGRMIEQPGSSVQLHYNPFRILVSGAYKDVYTWTMCSVQCSKDNGCLSKAFAQCWVTNNNLLSFSYWLCFLLIHLKNNINIIIIKIKTILWDRIRYKVDNELLSNFSKFSHCAVPRLVLLTTDVYKDDSGNSDVIIQP